MSKTQVYAMRSLVTDKNGEPVWIYDVDTTTGKVKLNEIEVCVGSIEAPTLDRITMSLNRKHAYLFSVIEARIKELK